MTSPGGSQMQFKKKKKKKLLMGCLHSRVSCSVFYDIYRVTSHVWER